MGKVKRKVFTWIFLFALSIFGCTISTVRLTDLTSTPFLPSTNTQVVQNDVESTPFSVGIWFDPGVPPDLKSQLTLPFQFHTTETRENSQISITPIKGSIVSSRWIYALVAAFPTVQDDVAFSDLVAVWQRGSDSNGTSRTILLTSTSIAAMENILGTPGNGTTEIVPGDQLVDRLWTERNSWGIVPFEDLQPRLKVFTIDGNSPLHKDFDTNTYPLKITFGAAGNDNLINSLQTTSTQWLPDSNRDPEKLTIINMTGTTALVRATAYRMETKGMQYPGEKIKDVLKEADFTDVSNEVSFTPDCPYPNPNTASLQFCSKPEYIQLLEGIGVNIVELTGNHMLDYNAQPFYQTLDMYSQRGWGVFGGGRDAESAKQPYLIENHGNRIAWIGCNVVGPEIDWATDSWPGAARCDFGWMTSEIQKLKSEGYIVIASLQDQEIYVPNPEPYIRDHFIALAAAGADIVQGSQAHFPQSFEFYQGSNTLIHYGLGNLYFDQMDNPVTGTRREFIDRHILYNGKYISTELITTMLEDYSQPRLMSKEERASFLQEYFNYSGW